MQYCRTFVALCLGFLCVQGDINEDRAGDWVKIGSGETCKERLQSLTMADQLNEKLTPKKCDLTDLQCKQAYQNPFVDSAMFGLQTVSEEDNTYVIEVYCYSEPGKFAYGGNTSFIEFVADSELKEITSEQMETVTFFENFPAIAKVDVSFGEYYSFASVKFANAALLLVSLGALALFKNQL